MRQEPLAASVLHAAAIDRFVQVNDRDYQDIREIRARTRAVTQTMRESFDHPTTHNSSCFSLFAWKEAL